VTGCFQVELDESPVAGMAGPQVLQHTRLGAGLQLKPDVLACLEPQLAIEQLLQRLGRIPATALGHISGGGQRESQVVAFPAGDPGCAERGEHGKVNCYVRGVVRPIRRDRSRTGLPHDPGLHDDETGGS
jgi:hypothetical protein